MYSVIQKEIIGFMPKEYYCHLQFVLQIALELHAKKGGDLEVIKSAAIAHDYGRIQDGDNSQHAEIGSEKVLNFLVNTGTEQSFAEHVARCTLMHNKTSGFQSIEEEIVSNADNISKVVFHEAFMLMCKKENYDERAKWAIKYLNKGYNNSTFADVKEQYRDMYKRKKALYENILKEEPATEVLG